MSTDDQTIAFPPAPDACRSCGSEDRAEAHYIASPLTGIPVTCTDDWHDEDARGPGDHEATLTDIPAIPAGPVRLTSAAPSCGTCGEVFAGDPEALGTTPLVAAALAAAVTSGGWLQDGDAWTCTVCLAKAAAGPAPAPPPAVVMPVPDTDPLDQSLTILAEIDAGTPGWWEDVNRSNNATAHKNLLRFRDGRHGFEALFSRTPVLGSDPEAAVALLNYEAELAERAEAMHRESLERSEAGHRAHLEQLAKPWDSVAAA